MRSNGLDAGSTAASLLQTCVCAHKRIDVRLLVQCPCVVEYAQAKVQLLFRSNAHKSV